jgi:predicted Zn-dependent peptidase
MTGPHLVPTPRLLWPGLLLGVACLSRTAVVGPAPVVLGERPTGAEERPAEVVGDVTALRTAGIPILVKRIPGADVVGTALFIQGGAGNWAPGQAGIEAVVLAAVVDLLRRHAAATSPGVEIGGDTAEDLSEIVARVPLAGWGPWFDLLANVFAGGEASDADFERARNSHLESLDVKFLDPQEHLARLAREAFFKGHRQAGSPNGTPEIVAGLKTSALRDHLTKLRERSRLLVVVVGDVDADTVAARVRQGLGPLPRGGFEPAVTEPPAFDRPSLQVVAAEGEIPFLCSLFSAPRWHEPGFAAGLVAGEALDAFAYQELREHRGLSYFQHAGIGTAWAFPAGRLVVASRELPLAFSLVREELDRLRAVPVPEDRLRGLKETAITKFFKNRQSTGAMARTIGHVQIRSGDWRWGNIESRIRAVTPADVQAFVRKYIVNLQTVVLGPDQKLEAGPFMVRAEPRHSSR